MVVRFAAFLVMVALGCVYSTSSPPTVTSDRFVVAEIRAEWSVLGDPCECIPGREEVAAYLNAAQTTAPIGTIFSAPDGREPLSLPVLYAGEGTVSVTVNASDGAIPIRADRLNVWARTPRTRVVQLGYGVPTRGAITRPGPDTIQFETELAVSLSFLDPSGRGQDDAVAAGGRVTPQQARVVIRAAYQRELL